MWCDGLTTSCKKKKFSQLKKINETLEKTACSIQKKSMRAAAETEYNLAEEEKNKLIRQIEVSFDGTYMTRGHTSEVGVATLI